MKLTLSLWVLAVAGFLAPAAVAGQPSGKMGWGQKARPDPVTAVLADAGAVTVPATQTVKYDAAYSVCKAVVPVSHEDFAIANVVLPMTSVTSYLLSHGVGIDRSKPLKIILSESPTHGEIRSEGYANGVYAYHPNESYIGPDQMTFVIEAQGMKFKVIETVWVANVAPEYGGCPADYKLPPATTGNDKGSALDIAIVCDRGVRSNIPTPPFLLPFFNVQATKT